MHQKRLRSIKPKRYLPSVLNTAIDATIIWRLHCIYRSWDFSKEWEQSYFGFVAARARRESTKPHVLLQGILFLPSKAKIKGAHPRSSVPDPNLGLLLQEKKHSSDCIILTVLPWAQNTWQISFYISLTLQHFVQSLLLSWAVTSFGFGHGCPFPHLLGENRHF